MLLLLYQQECTILQHVSCNSIPPKNIIARKMFCVTMHSCIYMGKKQSCCLDEICQIPTTAIMEIFELIKNIETSNNVLRRKIGCSHFINQIMSNILSYTAICIVFVFILKEWRCTNALLLLGFGKHGDFLCRLRGKKYFNTNTKEQNRQ